METNFVINSTERSVVRERARQVKEIKERQKTKKEGERREGET